MQWRYYVLILQDAAVIDIYESICCLKYSSKYRCYHFSLSVIPNPARRYFSDGKNHCHIRRGEKCGLKASGDVEKKILTIFGYHPKKLVTFKDSCGFAINPPSFIP